MCLSMWFKVLGISSPILPRSCALDTDMKYTDLYIHTYTQIQHVYKFKFIYNYTLYLIQEKERVKSLPRNWPRGSPSQGLSDLQLQEKGKVWQALTWTFNFFSRPCSAKSIIFSIERDQFHAQSFWGGTSQKTQNSKQFFANLAQH